MYTKGIAGIQNKKDNYKARKSGEIGENIVKDHIISILNEYDDLEYQQSPEDLTQIFIEEMSETELVEKFTSIDAVKTVNKFIDIEQPIERTTLYKVTDNRPGFRFGVFIDGKYRPIGGDITKQKNRYSRGFSGAGMTLDSKIYSKSIYSGVLFEIKNQGDTGNVQERVGKLAAANTIRVASKILDIKIPYVIFAMGYLASNHKYRDELKFYFADTDIPLILCDDYNMSHDYLADQFRKLIENIIVPTIYKS